MNDKRCTNKICPYCEETVAGWPERPECCEEIHAFECGDEGRGCRECVEKEDAEMQARFGLRPGMSQVERKSQLEAFRPVSDISEGEWQEWRRLK